LKRAPDNKPPKLSRPRSVRAHDKVLDAALELFAGNGIEATSIDSIAARSGVSKATIYKHWADKNALCLEALGRIHGLDRDPPKFDSGDLLQDLIDFLNHEPPQELSALRDRLMPHLISHATRDKEFGKAWRARVMEPGRDKAMELMRRGIAQGKFPADLDLTLGVALLIGPMMFRKVFSHIIPAPDKLAEGVAKAFWRAFSLPDPGKKPRR
jgi:AcrR family transcriptional regulator